jgi:SAM-dependent methyltransferase
VAAEYDSSRGGQARATAAARDLAAHLSGGELLELGVGTGIVAEALQREVAQLHRFAGVDISARMLHLARPRLPGGLLRTSADRLPLPDRQFDGVVAVHVLHLVTDLEATLAEAFRVLRPGGRMVALHGEPRHDQDDDLRRATRGLRALRPRSQDSAAAVRAVAQATGFDCLEQHDASPRIARHSPADLADLIARRSWSFLWSLDDQLWQRHVQPVIAALLALPEQDRPRVQSEWATVTVLQRPTEPGRS